MCVKGLGPPEQHCLMAGDARGSCACTKWYPCASDPVDCWQMCVFASRLQTAWPAQGTGMPDQQPCLTLPAVPLALLSWIVRGTFDCQQSCYGGPGRRNGSRREVRLEPSYANGATMVSLSIWPSNTVAIICQGCTIAAVHPDSLAYVVDKIGCHSVSLQCS